MGRWLRDDLVSAIYSGQLSVRTNYVGNLPVRCLRVEHIGSYLRRKQIVVKWEG